MKRWLIMSNLLLALAAPVYAHGPESSERLDKLGEFLQLDEYQSAELERVFTAQHERFRQMREQHRESGERPDRETMRANRESVRAEMLQSLSGVLSAEQLAKLEGYMEARMRETRRHRHGRDHVRHEVPDEASSPEATE